MNQEDLEKASSGVVFNIQKFTVHDGPGIRTEIFLKGCHLRCEWCSNPESFEAHGQVGHYPSKCLGISKCGKCITSCKQNALIVKEDKVVGINRSLCNDCLDCAKDCPTSTLKLWGKTMTLDEVMKVVRADKDFYDKSGGGVTISGGESLYQWRFTLEILKACKKEGIHTCVETAAFAKQSILDEILPFTDLIITDIKHMDSAIHEKYTSVGNEHILSNIKYIVEKDIPVVLRLPIIPNVNDSKEHIVQVADFIIDELKNKLCQVQFLRFRRLGEEKYASLNMPYNMVDVDPPREEFEERIKELVSILTDRNIPAFAGTTHIIKL